MTEHLAKLEDDVVAVNEASILEKADAAVRAFSRLIALLRDFEDRIATLEDAANGKTTTE